MPKSSSKKKGSADKATDDSKDAGKESMMLQIASMDFQRATYEANPPKVIDFEPDAETAAAYIARVQAACNADDYWRTRHSRYLWKVVQAKYKVLQTVLLRDGKDYASTNEHWQALVQRFTEHFDTPGKTMSRVLQAFKDGYQQTFTDEQLSNPALAEEFAEKWRMSFVEGTTVYALFQLRLPALEQRRWLRAMRLESVRASPGASFPFRDDDEFYACYKEFQSQRDVDICGQPRNASGKSGAKSTVQQQDSKNPGPTEGYTGHRSHSAAAGNGEPSTPNSVKRGRDEICGRCGKPGHHQQECRSWKHADKTTYLGPPPGAKNGQTSFQAKGCLLYTSPSPRD